MIKQNSFITKLYPLYIRKDDVILVLQRQQRLLSTIMIFTVLVLAIVQSVATPKLITLYLNKNNMSIVELFVSKSQLMTAICVVISIIIGLYLFFKEHSYMQWEIKLKKYKKHEMVRTSDVIEDGQIIALGLMIFMVELVLINTILALFTYRII